MSVVRVKSLGFNGISGIVNAPGEIPWELVLLYFVVAIGAAFILGKKYGGLKKFTTLDLVYIGIGSAFAVVWEFYLAGFISRALPSTPFISVGFWGRIFILFIVAALVRKVGVGMSTLFIFNFLSDIISYGFGGEPIYTIYEVLTYGLLIDLFIAMTGGNLFGVLGNRINSFTGRKAGVTGGSGEESDTVVAGKQVSPESKSGLSGGNYLSAINAFVHSTTFKAIVEGGTLAALLAFPDALLYRAFFSPFLYGGVVDWAKVFFDLYAFIPGDIVIGVLAALASVRIVKAIGH